MESLCCGGLNRFVVLNDTLSKHVPTYDNVITNKLAEIWDSQYRDR
jgi:hypothetical protein